MSTPREFYAPFLGLSRGTLGREDCEGLSTHLKNKKTIMEKFSVRHFLAIQQALEAQELGNVYWPSELGNPADGLTEIKSDVAPCLRLLESGARDSGILRPLKGAASCGI